MPNASEECPRLKKKCRQLFVGDKISFLHGAGIMSWSDLGSLDNHEWHRAKEDMPHEQQYDHGWDMLHYDARREYLEGLNRFGLWHRYGCKDDES